MRRDEDGKRECLGKHVILVDPAYTTSWLSRMHNIPLRIARLSRHASEGVQMLLETLAQDARFALRTLRLTPVFAATAVLTFGLGLGLHTMLFTLFNTYVLRPLAVSPTYSLYQLSFTTHG